jgi:hypothetical protein
MIKSPIYIEYIPQKQIKMIFALYMYLDITQI